MAIIPLRLLFAHWLAFLEALQQFFWNYIYIPQPLLSTAFPELIEDSSAFSPIVHVPRIRDPSDYHNSVDLSAICPVPTIFQTPLTMNLSCSVDRSDYDLNDASLAETSHYYVVQDIPVWGSAVPHEDKPQTSSPVLVGDDHAQTNMALYGARGLSFCPVLVGIVYTQSLLHLYMILMIPTLFNHWFEDVLVYESLDPTGLLDCYRYLHTSLWMAPWYLIRYGVRKFVPCLYRHLRRVSYKSARPPIPRIVLIRVDGEAVPVNFVEDHKASTDVDVWSSLKSANLKMHDGRNATSDSGEPWDFMPSLGFDGESRIATEFEALPTRTVSQQGERQGGIAEALNGIGLESFASEFADDSESPLFVTQIPDEQLVISSVLVEATNELLRSVKNDTLVHPIPRPHTLVTTSSDRSVDERTDEFEQMAFLETGENDVHQDSTDSPREREDSEQDVTFSPWSLVNGCGPDELETPSETMSATSSPEGWQDTPALVKNVRFAIGDDEGVTNCWEVSSSASYTDEYTCAWNLGSQLGDDGATSFHVPVVAFDPSMDRQDATSPEQVTKTVLSEMPSADRVEENDVVLAESLSPSFTGKPIVNLPMVATREDLRFVEMDPMFSVALIEDIATRSPLQILSPITPVVVINMNCITEAVEEQSFTPLETVKLDQGLPDAGHAFDRMGTLDDKLEKCKTSNIDSSREDKSCPSSPSVEGSNSVCSPIVDSEPPLYDVRTLEIVLSASTAVSEIGMQMVSTSVVATNTSPSAAIDVPGTNGTEILYETPRYYSNGKDVEISLRNELRGLEVSVPDETSTRIHLPAVSKSPKEPMMEDQGDFAATEKSKSKTVTLTGQPVSLSSALATGLLATNSSERLLATSGTCKGASPLAIISEEKKTGELDHGKSHQADTIPWDHLSTISKPPPERTLSGSMHAPSRSLRIPQTNSHTDIDPTSVLYETPPFITHSVSSVRPDEPKGGTSMITENISKRRQDLFASIHAPQRISKPNVQPSVSQLREESNRDHHRSVTNPVVVPEKKPVTKPCPPNWTAMPEVVNAFRMFKQAPSENTLRRVSSIAECKNKGPMLRAVGQKGIATSSLDSTSATRNIRSRWTHGSGLLLIRDLVSSDPADFNLRTCTNLRASKVRGMNTPPVQQVLYPGMLDIPPYALRHEIAPYPVRVNVDFSSMDAGSTGIQHPQRCRAGAARRRDRANAWFSTLDDLPGLREAEIL